MSAGGSGTWQPLPGADAVGGEDPFAGDCFDPTEQRQRQEEEEEEEEEGLSRPRGGALDWNLVHLGVSKEVHDRGKGEQLRAAGSIRNRKPHAIRAAVRYVASHQGSARELFCSFRNTAICGSVAQAPAGTRGAGVSPHGVHRTPPPHRSPPTRSRRHAQAPRCPRPRRL